MAKYSFILYPLAESANPLAELFRIWERKRRAEEDNLDHEGKRNPLERLMNFLKEEVESEERLSLTRSNFALKKEKVTKVNDEILRVTTAASLVSTTVPTCVFCNKN